MNTFARAQISIPNGHLSYLHRQGKDESPALMLIPGSFSSTAQWVDLVPLLDPDWTLVLMDMRGHGESWPPPENGSIEQFGQDALGIIDALGIQRFYIGGHSIGGMIALEVARTTGHRVKGVLCSEGWTNHHAQNDAFRGTSGNDLTPEQEAKRLEARATVDGRWTDQQIKEFAQIWRRWDGYPFLCQTDIPILEVYGDRGRAPASRKALHIPDRPNITLHWIPGAGHSGLPLARPSEIARAFSAFIHQVEHQV